MSFYNGETQRASFLKKQRQKERDELEIKKKKIEIDFSLKEIKNKFTTQHETKDKDNMVESVGLVTLDELKAQQEANLAKEKEENKAEEIEDVNSKIEEKIVSGPISFDLDEEEFEVPVKKKRYGINPNVQPHLVPDIYRKEEENKLREELKKEWYDRQAKLKTKEIQVPYSYWDGSGHRREVKIQRGDSVQAFLLRCLEQLRNEFIDLRSVSVDRLMYVKQDVIIPHHYIFHDLASARGRLGAMFEFLVNDDEITTERVVSKEEAAEGSQDVHDGKVCQRAWYEKNKHIFPASRWVPFDPEKHYVITSKKPKP